MSQSELRAGGNTRQIARPASRAESGRLRADTQTEDVDGFAGRPRPFSQRGSAQWGSVHLSRRSTNLVPTSSSGPLATADTCDDLWPGTRIRRIGRERGKPIETVRNVSTVSRLLSLQAPGLPDDGHQSAGITMTFISLTDGPAESQSVGRGHARPIAHRRRRGQAPQAHAHMQGRSSRESKLASFDFQVVARATRRRVCMART